MEMMLIEVCSEIKVGGNSDEKMTCLASIGPYLSLVTSYERIVEPMPLHGHSADPACSFVWVWLYLCDMFRFLDTHFI